MKISQTHTADTIRAAASDRAGSQGVALHAPLQRLVIPNKEDLELDTDKTKLFEQAIDKLAMMGKLNVITYVLNYLQEHGSDQSENDRHAFSYVQSKHFIMTQGSEKIIEEFPFGEDKTVSNENDPQVKRKRDSWNEFLKGASDTQKVKLSDEEEKESVLEKKSEQPVKELTASDAIDIINDWLANGQKNYLLTASRKAQLISLLINTSPSSQAKKAVLDLLQESIKSEIEVIYANVNPDKIAIFLDLPIEEKPNLLSGKIKELEVLRDQGMTRTDVKLNTPTEMARMIVELLLTDELGRAALKNLNAKKIVLIFDSVVSTDVVYDGKKFTTKTDTSSQGMEDKNQPEKTWLKKNLKMSALVSTVVHEYIHTLEQPNLSEHDSETDAHFGENQWREKVGLPVDSQYTNKEGKVDKEVVRKQLEGHTMTTEQERGGRSFIDFNEPAKRNAPGTVKLDGAKKFVDAEKGDYGHFTKLKPEEDSTAMKKRSKEFSEALSKAFEESASPLIKK